jgi:hypothetical protein
MAKLTGKQIEDLARSIIAGAPGGIRFAVLLKEIGQQSPETPQNTVSGTVWNLETKFPNEITKPSRGLYKPAGKSANEAVTVGNVEQVTPAGIKIKETDFYQPFAEWLKTDLAEVTAVAPLGGAGLKSKWGTPDVIGTYKPVASDLVKFPIEIVSTEIKIDPQAPVVAFG